MSPSDLPDESQAPLLAGNQEHDGVGATEREYGTATASAPPSTLEQGTFARNLGTIEAFGIIISIVIGSGVFTSPGAIDTNVPSPGVSLLIWLIGGVLAWTGASTLAELGTAIPGEGGIQPYLQYIFGNVFGFLAAWTWIVAVMPATLAILSIVFIETIYTAAGITDQAATLGHKILSVFVIFAITIANSLSTKASTRLNNFFVVTKFVGILVVAIAGLAVVILHLADPERKVGGPDWFNKPWFKYRNSANSDGSETDWSRLSHWEILGHLSAALYAALWAYSGWDKAIYISAELSNPVRQLPLAISTAIPTIILSFLAANAAYYVLLPWSVVATTDSVAVTSITRLLGSTFGSLTAGLICLVIAGSLLGNSFVASRMTVAAGNKKWLPDVFTVIGRVGTRSSIPDETASAAGDDNDDEASELPKPDASDAPINALLLSAVLSSLYILFGDFRSLLTFNGLGEYTFFFLTVVGVIVLRIREPGLRRPYKPHVAVPAVFAVVSGFVVVRGAAFAPVQAGVLVAVWGLGLLFYLARRWWF
ncbi:related to large neutral amino acid transporter [Cephalotrichum gorgonifer]|uniref:Related to large neutral amino acid transporter n=1 Tax=Cephalotrichum gorgonifer TaxID=2041049 RepID=A0AAE8N2M3_9PEZI|nr:related to large neutral amino acid transporter [Cephalotrichum gorgonifer]